MPHGPKHRGTVVVHLDQCKGCALCVEACPQNLLQISTRSVNRLGYFPVRFLADSCSGCGVCFYACPEPDALTVCRLIQEPVRTMGFDCDDAMHGRVRRRATLDGSQGNRLRVALLAPGASRDEAMTRTGP